MEQIKGQFSVIYYKECHEFMENGSHSSKQQHHTSVDVGFSFCLF